MNRTRILLAAGLLAVPATLASWGVGHAEEPAPPTTETTETTVVERPCDTGYSPCMADPQPEMPGAIIGTPGGDYELDPRHRLPEQVPPAPEDTSPADLLNHNAPTPADPPADPTGPLAARNSPQLPATGAATSWTAAAGAAALLAGIGALVVARRKA